MPNRIDFALAHKRGVYPVLVDKEGLNRDLREAIVAELIHRGIHHPHLAHHVRVDFWPAHDDSKKEELCLHPGYLAPPSRRSAFSSREEIAKQEELAKDSKDYVLPLLKQLTEVFGEETRYINSPGRLAPHKPLALIAKWNDLVSTSPLSKINPAKHIAMDEQELLKMAGVGSGRIKG